MAIFFSFRLNYYYLLLHAIFQLAETNFWFWLFSEFFFLLQPQFLLSCNLPCNFFFRTRRSREISVHDKKQNIEIEFTCLPAIDRNCLLCIQVFTRLFGARLPKESNEKSLLSFFSICKWMYCTDWWLRKPEHKKFTQYSQFRRKIAWRESECEKSL